MYQFTRDFVINDNVGKLGANKKRFLAKDGVLMIDHVANLRKAEIASAYHYEHKPAAEDVLAVNLASLDLDDYNPGDVLRLVITLGQEGRELSTFNDQYPWHARHYFYEAELNEDKSIEDVVWQFAKGIERDNSLSDLRYFVSDYEMVKRAEAAVKSFNLSASDCYIRFVNVRLVKVGKTDPCGACTIDHSHVGETLTGFKDWDKLAILARPELVAAENAMFKLTTVGTEGAGNVAQIIKNLRVPTLEHMDWFGMNINGVELPVPNGKYHQFLVEYVTERRNIGHQVMGAIDKSLVSFVFFVEDSVATDFATELGKVVAVSDVAPLDEAPADAWVEDVPARKVVKQVSANAAADGAAPVQA